VTTGAKGRQFAALLLFLLEMEGKSTVAL